MTLARFDVPYFDETTYDVAASLALSITIGGVTIARQKGSLSIHRAIEKRSTARFTVIDTSGVAAFSKGEVIEIKANLVLRFGGIIASVERRKFQKSATVFHAIRCVGFAALMDKRLVAETYTGDTAATIIADLATKYLNPEGITLGNIETGATIAEMSINYASMTKVMNALAEKSGFIWGVDEAKQLYFQERTTTLAPENIDVGLITQLSPSVMEHAPEYRNRQYIRAGRGVTSPQVEDFLGDGVVFAFTVGYPIHTVPTVKLATVTQTMGIRGLEVGKEVEWSKTSPVILFATAPGDGVAVEVTYVGEYNMLIVAEEPSEIAARLAIEGGTGIWEHIDDEPAITDVPAARDSAIAKLDKFATMGELLKFDTVTDGFEPGQMATVDWLSLGDMLIASVDTEEIADGKLSYRITAITGPSLGDWTTFFKRLAEQKDDILDRLTVGRDELVIIVVREGADWDWTDTITQNVFACPVPSATLFPEATLLPC